MTCTRHLVDGLWRSRVRRLTLEACMLSYHEQAARVAEVRDGTASCESIRSLAQVGEDRRAGHKRDKVFRLRGIVSIKAGECETATVTANLK